ncbi:MAG: hypothetical protein FJ294_11780 [Planctomycetes bacterium]|nr:hypothetical protein [Planctomycetota bacterium]
MRCLPTWLALVALLVWVPRAAAQVGPSIQTQVSFTYDTHWRSNPSQNEVVLASHTVRVGGATWLRLRFQFASLWHPGDETRGAFLRITSHQDGAVQELRTRSLQEWQLSTAYFNGDTVQLELVAPPRAGPSRVVLRNVWMGPLLYAPMSQCGATDDRLPTTDARIARTMPVQCTAWIFDDCASCMTTAGHCYANATHLDVAQFNVPLSTALGVLQHPPPEHQYAIDDTSRQFQNGGVGNDWASFGCFPNSNTSLTPFQAQGRVRFRIVPPTAPATGDVIRVSGYGSDSNDLNWSQTLQTHTGDFALFSGTTVRYTPDTFGGNSGSPVIRSNLGEDIAIGVHTHGGCNTTAPINSNAGTASTQALWSTARATPLGVCAPIASVQTYCMPKINSLGCTPLIAFTGLPNGSSGAGSFTIHATGLLNQTSGLLFYGYLPAAAPFQGGTLCVAHPIRRTPVQSTQGAATGTNCSGVFAFDMGAHIASGADASLACGAIAYAQVWSRDPNSSFGTSLTAGLRVAIGP